MKYFWSIWVGLCLAAILVNVQTVQAQLVELSAVETTYGNFGRSVFRAHNIQRSVELISIRSFQPGEQFSFNEATGRRTKDNGFHKAPVISSGRVKLDYGGGVCQTASTIYAAALYAGMTIVEHHSHSRISSYIKPGLDATVNWNTKDLKFKNPFSFPIFMAVAILPSNKRFQKTIKVIFSAQESFVRTIDNHTVVQLFQRFLKPFKTVVRLDPTLSPGERVVKEPGTPGVFVEVRRRTEFLNGFQGCFEDVKTITYRPSDRIILVGP